MSAKQSPHLRRCMSRRRRVIRFVLQRIVLRTLLAVKTRTTVEGRENVADLRPPFVVVANHASHLDTAVIVSRMPYRVVRQLAVGAAADHFYTNWLTRLATSLAFNTYPIHRCSGASRPEKGMSARYLALGVPLLIYPEGTRSRNGTMAVFRPGVAALCVDANVPCVPVALKGTGEAMPVGRSWPVAGRPAVHMTIGRPLVPLSTEDATAFNARIMAAVNAMRTCPAVRPGSTDRLDLVSAEKS